MADENMSDLCGKANEMMFDYADETLNEKDTAWFEAHIASCPDCAAELSKCRQTLNFIRVGRYEPPFSIAETVMTSIDEEKPKRSLVAAFIGTLKKKHLIRYGAIAAALIFMIAAMLNQDVLLRLVSGMTLSEDASNHATMMQSMEKAAEMSESNFCDFDLAEDEIDETVQHMETVSGMMMASPTVAGTGSNAGENDAESNCEENGAATSSVLRRSETENEIDASDADHALSAYDDTEAATNESVSNAVVEEGQYFMLPNEVETSENFDEDHLIFHYSVSAESYGNVIAYLNVSDINATMSVLGLTEYTTIENSDGSQSVLCVYPFDNRASMIDYLRLVHINYAVHYNGKELSESETNYVVLSEIK